MKGGCSCFWVGERKKLVGEVTVISLQLPNKYYPKLSRIALQSVLLPS